MPTTKKRNTTHATAVIYVRRSKATDGERSRSVAEQEAECRTYCDRQKITVVDVLEDDGRSASRYARKQRPEFKRLLSMVEAGEVTQIVAWSLDRLVRQPKELEALIDLAERGQLTVTNLGGGEVDLSTSDGRMTARVLVAVAAREADELSRRVRRAKQARAQSGRPSRSSGPQPFGWSTTDTPDPAEAALIVEAAADLLAGRATLGSIVRRWNSSGVRSRRGNAWSRVTVKDCLLRPRNAGLVEHRGEVIGDAPWPAIINPDQQAQLRAVLCDPSRFAPRAGRSWSTGIVFAADGTPMGPTTRGQGHKVYRTRSGSVSIDGDHLDALLLGVLFARVDTADLPPVEPAAVNSASVDAARSELAALDDRMAALGRRYAEGKVDDATLDAATDAARAERDRISADLGGPSRTTAAVLSPWLGQAGALRVQWGDLTADEQNTIARAVLGRVIVAPSDRRGGPFDPERITVEP